ncbi:uncharacterized protein LOC143286003 isoform X2 [Babylonia areolata]|uniref:uncharacterized protein LOC143286003 isoform X2 n=1 Tax=Babylonia areolata TaxID=304850 RepID=UPI003FD406ED
MGIMHTKGVTEDSALLGIQDAQVAADVDEPWESSAPNDVQWLPTEPNECHEALRHYATDVSVNSVAQGTVTSSSTVFLVQPTQGGKDLFRQRCTWGKGDAPSRGKAQCALVLAIVVTLGCGLVPGLVAIGMVIKAKRHCQKGRYKEAYQWLDYTFALIAVTVFVGIPVYIYIFVYRPAL